jgi:hypothetical protein
LALVVIAPLAIAEDREPGPRVSVAVLEPEFITENLRTPRQDVIAWLDSAITLSLRNVPLIGVLERQRLDQILAERELQETHRTTDDVLRPFLAAGVLVCPTIVATPKGDGVVITIEAVLAERGDIVEELILTAAPKGGTWHTTPDLAAALADFWKAVQSRVVACRNMPSLEIPRIDPGDDVIRLQWLANEITDGLDAAIWPGVILLRPRQTVHAKEERLLRMMGLSRPEEGDATAGFMAASDYQLAGTLADGSEPGTDFEQAPVVLTLRLAKGDAALAETMIKGIASDPRAIKERAITWAAEAIAADAATKGALVDQKAVVRSLATRELAIAERLASLEYAWGDSERARLERLAQAALRAAHLDPTSEKAAYLAAVSIEGKYLARGQSQTLAAKERVIHLCEQYLERFPKGSYEHRRMVLWRLSSATRGAASMTPGPISTWSTTPRVADGPRYRYARKHVTATLELGIIENEAKKPRGNALHAGSSSLWSLVRDIPDEVLDKEQAFWRTVWRERIEPLGDVDVLPWEIIESRFHVRRKDVAGVRRCFEELATRPEPNRTDAWRKRLMKGIERDLQEAGDPEWQTWRPKLTPVASLPPATFAEAKEFHVRFHPPYVSIWDYDESPVAPGAWIQFPESVCELGRTNRVVPYPRVEFLIVAGDTAWFAAPHLYDKPNNDPHHLLAVPLARILGRGDSVSLADADITIIPWPSSADGRPVHRPRIAKWAVTGTAESPTVWIGTREAGLARFDRDEGAWVGRWYAESEGVPLEIAHLAADRQATGESLVVVGYGPEKRGSPRDVMVLSIDPESHAVRLVLRGGIDRAWSADGVIGLNVAVVGADGRRVPLALLGAPLPEPFTLEQAKGLARFQTGISEGQRLAVTRHDADPRVRVWAFPGIPAGSDYLREIDPKTLRALAQPAGDTPRPEFDDRDFVDTLLKRNLPGGAPIARIGQCVGVGGDLWMTMTSRGAWHTRGEGEALVVYRPAARGAADWAKHDLWLGPFLIPDRGDIFSLSADGDGRVWASGAGGVFVTDSATLGAHATKIGQAMSTQGWRDAYAKRVAAAPWRQQVRTSLARRNFEATLALLDEQAERLPAGATALNPPGQRIDWTDMALYRVMTLAHMGRTDDAMQLADTIRANESIELAARRHAAGMRIRILAHQKQWQEVLDAIVDLEGALDTGPVAPWSEVIRTSQAALRKAP